MDLLFAAPTPWAWDAEKTFAALKEEMGGEGRLKGQGYDIEAKGDPLPTQHVESK
jgi:hypothetical protein